MFDCSNMFSLTVIIKVSNVNYELLEKESDSFF